MRKGCLLLSQPKDHPHAAARECLEQLESLICSWPDLTETRHLLLTRLGNRSQMAFVQSLRQGVCEILELGFAQLPRIETLMRKYRDLSMDLADASLVVLPEHLGQGGFSRRTAVRHANLAFSTSGSRYTVLQVSHFNNTSFGSTPNSSSSSLRSSGSVSL